MCEISVTKSAGNASHPLRHPLRGLRNFSHFHSRLSFVGDRDRRLEPHRKAQERVHARRTVPTSPRRRPPMHPAWAWPSASAPNGDAPAHNHHPSSWGQPRNPVCGADGGFSGHYEEYGYAARYAVPRQAQSQPLSYAPSTHQHTVPPLPSPSAFYNPAVYPSVALQPSPYQLFPATVPYCTTPSQPSAVPFVNVPSNYFSFFASPSYTVNARGAPASSPPPIANGPSPPPPIADEPPPPPPPAAADASGSWNGCLPRVRRAN